MDETYIEHQAAQFRVALLLKQYKFGAASAAKYLGKSRGLIQSWMQIGNKHYLAKEKIKLKSFERIVRKLRKRITEENINYFLVNKLLDMELPVAFVSKVMSLPTSTVRSWKYGKVPTEIKKFFYEPKFVEHEFEKMLKNLKAEITRINLEYFLAVRLADHARQRLGRRRIGGRIISQILTQHFSHLEPIPEKTISCWIDGKRKPWSAFEVLADENRIRRELNKIIDELTYQHLKYHISKELADEHGWKYSKISAVLGLNKEHVRGWIKKDRGNPIAKTFVNTIIVKENLKEYGYVKGKTQPVYTSKDSEKRRDQKRNDGEINKINIDDHLKIAQSNLTGPEKELEQELIYHLGTFPTGITSTKVLKSILINYNDVSLELIEKVMNRSNEIVKSKYTGKWILKKYEEELYKDKDIDEELSKINCKRDKDGVVCSE